jgi:integrase
MRQIGKLPAVALQKEMKPGMHADGGGLYLQVTKSGAKSWIFRFMINGRARAMGLGPLHTVSLAKARTKARECRELRLDGIDPIEVGRARRTKERLAAATAMTFRQCAEAYIKAHKAGWKNGKHSKQWPSTLEAYVYPVFGDLPVQSVDIGLIMKVLEPIWNGKPETASRVRGRIESILDWARARNYRDGENPARWKGHLDQLLPRKSKVARAVRQAKGKSEHHPAMPYEDLSGFVTELRERTEVSAKALEFTILTVKRTVEVIGARWPEISVSDKLWTIPPGRMKGEREHRVPLSDDALAVIEGMRPISSGDPNGLIFPGAKKGKGLGNMAMLKLLQSHMGHPEVTVHGFRSTFRDWAAERTNFPNEVAEMALAHMVNDKVEAAYRRGDLFDKRRQLMDSWARYCTG